MAIRGWIYVATNKSLEGLVKVGFSTKDPVIRIGDFDNAGLPYPYELAYDALVNDPYPLEQAVHKHLGQKRENREWFRCSVIEAISSIRQMAEQGIIKEVMHLQIADTPEQIKPEGSKPLFHCACGEIFNVSLLPRERFAVCPSCFSEVPPPGPIGTWEIVRLRENLVKYIRRHAETSNPDYVLRTLQAMGLTASFDGRIWSLKMDNQELRAEGLFGLVSALNKIR